MKGFMDKDFLLTTDTARRLYHEVAAQQPIFDYHCHLSPREIAENKRFSDLAEVWLGGDHYKWRAMRSNGVDERLVTGDGKPYDKFFAWATTIPNAIGNPLYHWTHLELQRYFGISEPLDERSAPAIWEKANAKLPTDELSVYGIFKNFRVHAVGTTDDPADSLEWHARIKAEGRTTTKVLPSFRPDKAVHLDRDGFPAYVAQLGTAAGVRIEKLADLLEALKRRVAFFDSMGCRASDHALEYPPFELASDGGSGAAWEAEVAATFAFALSGGKPDARAADSYKTFLLSFLGAEYADRGWAMQLHLAAIRNNSSRMFKALGPDTGFDATHDMQAAAKLARLLDLLDSRGKLPRTILYSLNPKDWYSLGTLMGCFQGGGIPGKIQLGSAWWFCDHKDGMSEQLRLLGNLGLLPRFIGMLTDSRSFLSYPRHEYFRRILCELLGRWAEDGEIPASTKLLDRIVADISFGNAERYFGS
ncbi:MAG: glucuronate isomerase [Treponema sp. GWB1_62_6]|nr:MAG: glucuronate isomerase [Treponema sp. GWB1_62_6]OHE67345.1 MAG: glucuronate isomerase [Treponema sp. GWA1_62_8]OHE70117.1 MAG: glucuronate isomerase [Treponema sp. GWC1_61_84]HCM28171.1 glucuronate isomerase [Treponema sp.]